MAVALGWSAAPAQATIRTFTFTGAEQMFVVPGGVSSIHVVAIGGRGGVGGGSGAPAAQVTADVSVIPGQTLYVEVGGPGKDSGAGGSGGFNGGAAGGGGAGGGGGATDIRTTPLADGLTFDHRLIVAAGGGGGGGTGASIGGAGGAAGSPGEESESSGNMGGGAGTAVAGGSGGFGAGEPGLGGELGQGGSGGNGEVGTNSGGGGAGGYYGGGGGGGGLSFGGGGGGGGSSLIPPAGSMVLASLATAPEVQITYTLVSPSITIVSPADGGTYVQGQAVTANYSCTPPEGTSVKTCAGPAANGAAIDTVAPGPHTFTVFAEDADGATSSQKVSYTVVAAPATSSAPAPAPPGAAKAPDTVLGSHPKKPIKTKKQKASINFSFSSDVAGATFQCKLDSGDFASCTSPKSYKVKVGRHTFSVAAVSNGVVDSTPASVSFKVVKAKKKH